MKKTLTVTKQRAQRLPFNNACGCPLHEQLKEKGFDVNEVDVFDWTDTAGKRHKFDPPFTLWRYARVLSTGKSFKTTTSDD